MIIFSDERIIVITPPRTGSSTLNEIVKAEYRERLRAQPPMILYRHMEVDGIPRGYEDFLVCGIVRDPVDRLYSLYHYLKRSFNGRADYYGLEYAERVTHGPKTLSFEEWVLTNEVPFSDNRVHNSLIPKYTTCDHTPETRKSLRRYYSNAGGQFPKRIRLFGYEPNGLLSLLALLGVNEYLRDGVKMHKVTHSATRFQDTRTAEHFHPPAQVHPKSFSHALRQHLVTHFEWDLRNSGDKYGLLKPTFTQGT